MRTHELPQVSTADRLRLAALVDDPCTCKLIASRAAIILMAARGCEAPEIRWRTGKHRGVVARWMRRFQDLGLDGLLASEPWLQGRVPLLELRERWAAISRDRRRDQEAATRLTEFGRLVVHQIWHAHRLQLRLPQTQLSDDPDLMLKMRQIVTLYIDPPPNSVVLAFDEKGQIPVGPRGLSKARSELGARTTTFFVILNLQDGRVMGRCMQRQRHQEFIRVLNQVEAEIPAGTVIHLVLDNYAPHRHPSVFKWLTRHPRFRLHFTPTRMSWLNAAELVFARMSPGLRGREFGSIIELQRALHEFVAGLNADLRPFPAIYSSSSVSDRTRS